MAEPSKAFLIDQDGKVGAFDSEDAGALMSSGYIPAGTQQIEDYQKEQAFHAKYGTLGQQAKTFGEGAAQALTLGLSTYAEKALGVGKEDIAARQMENPLTHMAGTVAGVAAPLIATAGGSAALEGGAMGAEAGEGLLGGAAELSAPSLIAKVGGVGSRAVEGLLGGGESAVARIAAKAAASGAGSAIEGAAYGLGQVVHESALGDPNLTASRMIEEIGLSALLGGGIGAGTGALGQLVGETAGGKLGQKLVDWAQDFEPQRAVKTAGGIKSDIKAATKNMSREGFNQIMREAGDSGLVTTFDTAASVAEKSQAAMDSAGAKMGDILKASDASGAAPKSFEEMMDRVHKEVLSKMEDSPFREAAADKIQNVLARYEDKFAGRGEEAGMGFRDLHGLRKDISDELYGLKGNMDAGVSYYKEGLHDVRSIVSDEISKGMDAAGLNSSEWKEANRAYQVASTVNKIAEKGVIRAQGNNLIPLTSILGGLGGIAGGGPLGGVALGAASFLARKYGSGVLAAGARTMRQFIEDGAAEGLASKTADAIALARRAGEGVEDSGAARLAGAWNRVSEKLAEPVGNPVKDALRDSLQEHMAEKGAEGTPVETVAALSQIERASNRVQNRIENQASALVNGSAKVARGEAMAGVSGAFAKDTESSQAAHQKRAENIRQLASSPELMQQRMGQIVADLHEHAPETAQALQVAMARAVATLNAALPQTTPRAPLAKPEAPSRDQLATFHRTFEVVARPSLILKQAAAGTVTPSAISAVRQAHPAQFAAMQQALTLKLAGFRGTIPYNQRQMIGLVLGQDVDGSYNPSLIQASQASFAAQDQASPGNKPASKGLEKLHLSSRLLTPAQAAATRGLGDE